MITNFTLDETDDTERDYFISPVSADKSVLRQFPKTFMLTCNKDPLRDSAILFGYLLSKENVEVYVEDYLNMLHGELNLSMIMGNKEAEKYLKRNCDILKSIYEA